MKDRTRGFFLLTAVVMGTVFFLILTAAIQAEYVLHKQNEAIAKELQGRADGVVVSGGDEAR